jgi:hypothetical protein
LRNVYPTKYGTSLELMSQLAQRVGHKISGHCKPHNYPRDYATA